MTLALHDIDPAPPACLRERILPPVDRYRRDLVRRRRFWRAVRLYGLQGTLALAIVAVGIAHLATTPCRVETDMVLLKSGRVVECK